MSGRVDRGPGAPALLRSIACAAAVLLSACSPEGTESLEQPRGNPGAATATQPPAVVDEGVVRRMSLHLYEQTSVAVVAARVAGVIDLRASLSLRDDVRGRRTLLTVEEVQALTWTVDARAVEGGVARLEGAQALVTWDARGAASAVEVPETTSAEVARLLRTLALSLQTPMGAADGAPLESPYGRVRVHVSGSPQTGAAEWANADYLSVSGARDDSAVRGQGALRYTREAGLLVEAHYREELVVSDARSDLFSAELALDLMPHDGADPVHADPWPQGGLVGAAQVASSAAGRALEGRAAGLTFEQLLRDVVAQRDSGRMPEHERWLWRASGRLLLEPQHASTLGQACVDGTLEGPGRALALDLLANVGHPPAQAAVRQVLGHPTVVAGADYPTLLQHAVLIEAPEAATLSFFEERVASLAGLPRRAAVVTLGALVGRARVVDPDLAAAHSEGLRAALESAQDPTDQRAVLMALGNARDTLAEPRIRERVASPGAGVRAAALRALGWLSGSADSRRLLVERALHDEDGGARSEALGALARLGATADELGQLAAAVRGGSVARADLGVLANFARRCALNQGQSDALLALIEALLAHPLLPRDLGHQLAQLRATDG